MAVKWETVKAGDTLYSTVRRKMGNTAMSGTFVYAVIVKEIDHAAGRAVVSWNGNRPEPWTRRRVERLRRSRPAVKQPLR